LLQHSQAELPSETPREKLRQPLNAFNDPLSDLRSFSVDMLTSAAPPLSMMLTFLLSFGDSKMLEQPDHAYTLSYQFRLHILLSITDFFSLSYHTWQYIFAPIRREDFFYSDR